MTEPHFRRCWDCGHIDRYADGTIPECLCRKCKSADTRRMKNEPPLWKLKDDQRGLYVPQNVALCPECGDDLIARSMEWEQESGRPVATGIEIECVSFLRESLDQSANAHEFRQCDWQGVRDKIAKWCSARVDYGR